MMEHPVPAFSAEASHPYPRRLLFTEGPGRGVFPKSISSILHKSKHTDTLELSEAMLQREGDHNLRCSGYKYTIANAAFVAGKEEILAALVYSLV